MGKFVLTSHCTSYRTISQVEQCCEQWNFQIHLPIVVSTVNEYKKALANVQSNSGIFVCGYITAPVKGTLFPSNWAVISSVILLISWSWNLAISSAASLLGVEIKKKLIRKISRSKFCSFFLRHRVVFVIFFINLFFK